MAARLSEKEYAALLAKSGKKIKKEASLADFTDEDQERFARKRMEVKAQLDALRSRQTAPLKKRPWIRAELHEEIDAVQEVAGGVWKFLFGVIIGMKGALRTRKKS